MAMESPIKLEDICIQFIASNLDSVTTTEEVEPLDAALGAVGADPSLIVAPRSLTCLASLTCPQSLVCPSPSHSPPSHASPVIATTSHSAPAIADPSLYAAPQTIHSTASSACNAKYAKRRRVFRGGASVYLHHNLADTLLAAISARGALTDDALALFDPAFADLRRVHLGAGAMVTPRGLRVLRGHRAIAMLSAAAPKAVAINELVGSLGDSARAALRSLSVAGGRLSGGEGSEGVLGVPRAGFGPDVLVGLSGLRGLRALDLSGTTLDTHALGIVVQDLPCLDQLDISETRVVDISALLKCRQRLRCVIYIRHIDHLTEHD